MAKDDDQLPANVFGGAVVSIEDSDRFVAAMEDTVDYGARGGDVSYMSFSGKKGGYKIGVDGRSPDPDEHFVVAPTMFTTGYICWKGGKPAAKRMAKLGQPKVMEPDEDELGPFTSDKDGWFKARGMTMKSIEEMEQIEFTTNSKSGVAVIQDLQRDVLDRYKAGMPCVPIITLSEEEFTAQGNSNMKPVFTVTKWLTVEQLTQLGDPEFDPMKLLEDDDEDEDEPKAAAPRSRRRL